MGAKQSFIVNRIKLQLRSELKRCSDINHTRIPSIATVCNFVKSQEKEGYALTLYTHIMTGKWVLTYASFKANGTIDIFKSLLTRRMRDRIPNHNTYFRWFVVIIIYLTITSSFFFRHNFNHADTNLSYVSAQIILKIGLQLFYK